MAIYVNNIHTLAQAQQALNLGAWAIGVPLSNKSGIAVELIRDWLFGFDFRLFKVGQFIKEPYYQAEELVSFCGLDIIHLTEIDRLLEFSRTSSRLLLQLSFEDLPKLQDPQIALIQSAVNGLILQLPAIEDSPQKTAEAGENAKTKELLANLAYFESLLWGLEKPIYLAGNFNLPTWKNILKQACNLQLAGFMIDAAAINPPLIQFLKEPFARTTQIKQ